MCSENQKPMPKPQMTTGEQMLGVIGKLTPDVQDRLRHVIGWLAGKGFATADDARRVADYVYEVREADFGDMPVAMDVRCPMAGWTPGRVQILAAALRLLGRLDDANAVLDAYEEAFIVPLGRPSSVRVWLAANMDPRLCRLRDGWVVDWLDDLRRTG